MSSKPRKPAGNAAPGSKPARTHTHTSGDGAVRKHPRMAALAADAAAPLAPLPGDAAANRPKRPLVTSASLHKAQKRSHAHSHTHSSASTHTEGKPKPAADVDAPEAAAKRKGDSKVSATGAAGKLPKTSADDLDDVNFVVEDLDTHTHTHGSEDEDASVGADGAVGTRFIEDVGSEEEGAAAPAAAAAAGKKRPRPSSASARKGAAAGAHTYGKTAEEQAAAVWTAFRTSSFGRDFTDLEVGSAVPASCMTVIPAESLPSRAQAGMGSDVSDIATAVKTALPAWKREFGWKAGAPKRRPGHPAIIIVTYAARRAADMLKPLRVFNARIAKLFAKHLSIEEQKAILEGPPVVLAVGTPNRISKLLEAGDLHLDDCKSVIVDVHPDPKSYTLFDHPNLSPDWWALFHKYLRQRLADEGATLKLALY